MSALQTLVVDDSASARNVLKRLLERKGAQVDQSESGIQALDYLKTKKPDIIFMDHTMPGMSGIEFLEEVREWDMDLPVIFVSGQDSSKARAKGIAGASALIAKPFKKDTLLKTVHKVLSSNSPPAEMSLETEETEKLDY